MSIAIGRIVSACVPVFPETIVPYTGNYLRYLTTWEEEETPDSYAGPPGKAGLRKASNNILRSLAKQNPTGFAEEVHSNRKRLYDIFFTADDSSTTSPGDESKAIRTTVLHVVNSLSKKHPEALQPVLSALANNLHYELSFEALTHVAEGAPELIFESADSFSYAVSKGREFEPGIGEVDYPYRVKELLRTAGTNSPATFYKYVEEWTKKNAQDPQMTRTMIEIIHENIKEGGSMQNGWSTVLNFTDHPDWQVRLTIVEILGALNDPRAESQLEKLLDDPIPEVSEAAEATLSEQG